VPNDLKTIVKIAEAQRLLDLCRRAQAEECEPEVPLEFMDWARVIEDLCRDRIAVLTIAGEPRVQGDPGTVVIGQSPKLDPFFLNRSHQRYGSSDHIPKGTTASAWFEPRDLHELEGRN